MITKTESTGKQRLVVHSLKGSSFRFLLLRVHVAQAQSPVSHTGRLDSVKYHAVADPRFAVGTDVRPQSVSRN